MRISEERKSRLYEAISEPLMELRIENQQATTEPTKEELDRLLFGLEQQIWKRVAATLGIGA